MKMFLLCFSFFCSFLIAEEIQKTSTSTDGFGNLVYLYGKSIPVVLASPLFSGIITLEEGEVLRDYHVGDIDNWAVSTSLSGPKDFSTPHVIVKPLRLNVATNLIINTDKRIYTIKLASIKLDWAPQITFRYDLSGKVILQNNVGNDEKKTNEKENVSPLLVKKITGISSLTEIDFSYHTTSRYSWKPLRVFNDKIKTYIEMPKAIMSIDAPVFFVVDSGKMLITNYRVLTQGKIPNRRTFYVVDRLFKKANLVKGVGLSQQKVVITKVKE